MISISKESKLYNPLNKKFSNYVFKIEQLKINFNQVWTDSKKK